MVRRNMCRRSHPNTLHIHHQQTLCFSLTASFPELLMLHLKRFRFGAGSSSLDMGLGYYGGGSSLARGKIDDLVRFPHMLDLRSMVVSGVQADEPPPM